MKKCLRNLMLIPLCLCAIAANADDLPLPQGYLCCNMRDVDGWISDINYVEGAHLLPAGTPVAATGYGHYRVYVDINGRQEAIGNDYSRTLDMGAFAKRYIVPNNPARKLARYPARIRKAIKSARVMKGMTREQVIMSLGYPITSENATLNSNVWRYWVSSFAEYDVVWGKNGRVRSITADPMTRNLVEMPK